MQLYSNIKNEIFQEVTWTWTDPETKRVFDYTLVKKDVSWNEAQEFCTARGTRLAQPDSQMKSDNIRANIPTNSPQSWFGARKVINQWQYTDGSTLTFTDWSQGKCIYFMKH